MGNIMAGKGLKKYIKRPYVKIYLLPEENPKSLASTGKAQAGSPTWSYTCEIPIDNTIKQKYIKLRVVHKKSNLPSAATTVAAETTIPLSLLKVNQDSTAWHKLSTPGPLSALPSKKIQIKAK